jgi:hypothetical protein
VVGIGEASRGLRSVAEPLNLVRPIDRTADHLNGRSYLLLRRVRGLAGQELALPSWEHAVAEDWLGKWAMNLMLINVSTRKFRRAVRLPEGDVPAPAGLACRNRRLRGTSWRCRRRA